MDFFFAFANENILFIYKLDYDCLAQAFRMTWNPVVTMDNNSEQG